MRQSENLRLRLRSAAGAGDGHRRYGALSNHAAQRNSPKGQEDVSCPLRQRSEAACEAQQHLHDAVPRRLDF